ncbi:hypothetical protein [Actinokineospora sp. UTMC 2448]|uniref:hypothetical protein n=1 Tax=Actinokineospora sp. UTMC 2448 TaxID=2268449 RepID=UPI0021645B25|nr:hypothetical protein [Actinokineospora sp. UTMC 2448]UVS77330.1 hypothetical protein Actkin_01039 [Actinokineospora sp. UTMC 2448]
MPAAAPGVVFQSKLDGWRTAVSALEVIQTRGDRDVAARFPEIAAALGDVVLHGELGALRAGHTFRYPMFVCVTAPDLDRLRRAVSSVRRRLTRIKCSAMPLYGEQDQAFFAAALPLARGLSPMRGLTGS